MAFDIQTIGTFGISFSRGLDQTWLNLIRKDDGFKVEFYQNVEDEDSEEEDEIIDTSKMISAAEGEAVLRRAFEDGGLEVLSALASGSVRPEFRVSYTVSDPEGARNALLERAVADATEKAAALTRAGGVPLGDLQSIDYSWGRIDFEVLPRKVDGLVECCEIPIEAFGCAPDITPDDIEVSDAVTVVWEIGERNDP